MYSEHQKKTAINLEAKMMRVITVDVHVPVNCFGMKASASKCSANFEEDNTHHKLELLQLYLGV